MKLGRIEDQFGWIDRTENPPRFGFAYLMTLVASTLGLMAIALGIFIFVMNSGLFA